MGAGLVVAMETRSSSAIATPTSQSDLTVRLERLRRHRLLLPGKRWRCRYLREEEEEEEEEGEEGWGKVEGWG